jgi:hypothetical protein
VGFTPSYGFGPGIQPNSYPGIDSFNPMIGESSDNCFQGYDKKASRKDNNKKNKKKPVWEESEPKIDEWNCEPPVHGSKKGTMPDPENYQQEGEMARQDAKFEGEYFPGLALEGPKDGKNMLEQLMHKPKEEEKEVFVALSMDERWAALDNPNHPNAVQKLKEEQREMESQTAKNKRQREAKKKAVDPLAYPSMDAQPDPKAKQNRGKHLGDFPGLGGDSYIDNPEEWGTKKIEDPLGVVIKKKSKKGKGK